MLSAGCCVSGSLLVHSEVRYIIFSSPGYAVSHMNWMKGCLMVYMDPGVGAGIDTAVRQPHGRKVKGPWLDKNTTINLHPSGDQCLNAFLIGFDGVCEIAARHLALTSGRSLPALPWIHTSWRIDFKLIKHCSRAQAPWRLQICH